MAHHSVFLEKFIKENKIKVFAEVGVFRSRLLNRLYDTCSSDIKIYWAIDPWLRPKRGKKDYARHSEKDWHNFYRTACSLMQHWPALHVVRLTSAETARLFDKPYFDFVYIDALHDYPAVLGDIKMWLPRIKKGGFIGGHDCDKKRPGVVQAVNEVFGKKGVSIGDNMVWYKKV